MDVGITSGRPKLKVKHGLVGNAVRLGQKMKKSCRSCKNAEEGLCYVDGTANEIGDDYVCEKYEKKEKTVIDKNKWQLLITYADNGMILENPNYVFGEEEYQGEKLNEVIEFDPDGEMSLEQSRLIKKMVYKIVEYFGMYDATSKHSKYNIVVEVLDVEKNEEINPDA